MMERLYGEGYTVSPVDNSFLCRYRIDNHYFTVDFEKDKVKTWGISKVELKPDSNLVYRNYKCGYQLVFPESWRGYYIIDEGENGTVGVNFFGKSKTGTISLKSNGINGLPMFMIIKETELEKESPVDSSRKIGTINGVNYYIASGTGSYLVSLIDIADITSALRQTVRYEVNEAELGLAKKDWIKISEMLKEKDSVLKTFSPIK